MIHSSTKQIDHFNNDQIINQKINRAIIEVTKIINFSRHNDREKQSLFCILEVLQLIKDFVENPSLNYLYLKQIIWNDFNGKLELDGTCVLFSFVDEACPSRIIKHTVKL